MVLLQNSEKRTSGPNAAPNPAQANETMRNTELSGFHARNTAIMAMMRSESLATRIRLFSLSFTWKKEVRISCDTELDAARSCESAVDIVEAMMPDRIRPAISAGKNPKLLRRWAISMITVSEEPDDVSSPITPALVMPSPIRPIRIATPMAMTTQILAIRLESFSFRSSSIAMNRRRICGIPK